MLTKDKNHLLHKGKLEIIKYRNTNKLVSDATNIVVINSNDNNRIIYSTISECANSLNISRKKIKYCLNTGEYYKGYSFVLS